MTCPPYTQHIPNYPTTYRTTHPTTNPTAHPPHTYPPHNHIIDPRHRPHTAAHDQPPGPQSTAYHSAECDARVCVAQCVEGHIFCAECMTKHRNSDRGESSRRCPMCRNRLGDTPIRNRALETVIGYATVKCPFQFGLSRCDAKPCRKDLNDHMNTAKTHHIELLDAVQADAITTVVALLTTGLTNGVKTAAAEALQHLARTESHRVAIAEAGAIAPLIALLSGTDGTKKGAQAAARVLHGIAECSTEKRTAVAEAGAIPHLVRLLSCGKAGATEEENMTTMAAAQALESLAKSSTYNLAIFTANAVTALVLLLSAESTDDVRVQATRVLTNLAKRATYRSAIVDAGAVPLLVTLLDVTAGTGGTNGTGGAGRTGTSENNMTDAPKTAALAAARLLNYIALSAQHRDAIIQACALPHLVAMLSWMEAGSTGIANSATMATTQIIQNLASCARHQCAIIQAGALPALVALLHEGETQGTVDARVVALAATKVLHTLATRTENHMAMLEAGVVFRLMKCINGRERDAGIANAELQRLAAVVLEQLTDGIRKSTTATLLAVQEETEEVAAFHNGARARLRGLITRDVTLDRWDQKTDRWRVHTDDGTMLAVKVTSLLGTSVAARAAHVARNGPW